MLQRLLDLRSARERPGFNSAAASIERIPHTLGKIPAMKFGAVSWPSGPELPPPSPSPRPPSLNRVWQSPCGCAPRQRRRADLG